MKKPVWSVPVSASEFRSVTKPFHFNVHTLLNLKKGQKVKFLCLDRNYMDFISDNTDDYNPKPAKEMFKNNYILEYIHDKGSRGKAKFIYLDKYDEDYQDWEWDLEWKPDTWFPLTKGRLIPITEKHDGKLVIVEGRDIPVKNIGAPFQEWSYDPRTEAHYDDEDYFIPRVGWRGPVIPFELLDFCPFVYTKFNEDITHELESTMTQLLYEKLNIQ